MLKHIVTTNAHLFINNKHPALLVDLFLKDKIQTVGSPRRHLIQFFFANNGAALIVTLDIKKLRNTQ